MPERRRQRLKSVFRRDRDDEERDGKDSIGGSGGS
jgi:hypothetical protein